MQIVFLLKNANTILSLQVIYKELTGWVWPRAVDCPCIIQPFPLGNKNEWLGYQINPQRSIQSMKNPKYGLCSN